MQPVSTRAQVRDPAAGEALFTEGRRLLKAGETEAACSKFAESLRLDAAARTLANLAGCEEQLGRTASAWEHWRWAADQMDRNDARRATAVARVAALEKVIPRLTLVVLPGAPADLRVERDGVALGAASLGVALPLDPGPHVVVTTAAGRQPRRYELVIAAAEQRELAVLAGDPVAPASRTASGVSPSPLADGTAGIDMSLLGPPGPAPHSRRRAIVGYALAGVSVAALGTGILFATQALSARDEARGACGGPKDPPTCWSRARSAVNRDFRASRNADIAFGTAVVAAVAGSYLLFTGRSAAVAPDQGVRVGAAPLRGGGEVQLAASF